MTDLTAHLAAIIDRPDDDLPRLIYADALEENGDGERAEFIRVQCDIAAQGPHPAHPGVGQNCTACALRRRERELLAEFVVSWTQDLPEEICNRQCPNCADRAPDYETNVVECNRCECTGLIPDYDHMTFTRGFVSEITLSWQDWLTHHAAILAACPIRNAKDGLVRLTTWPEPVWIREDVIDQRTLAESMMGYLEWHSPGVRFTVP